MKSTGDDLKTLRGADKHWIYEALIALLQREARGQPNAGALDDAAIEQAIRALSYREALLYRDWQAALIARPCHPGRLRR
jgi:hypothetical protein